jgi:nucleoside-diphosphate-sugar epimerase
MNMNEHDIKEHAHTLDTKRTGNVVFITGAAGYVGTMLVKKFAAREDVEQVIGLDKEPIPEFILDTNKFTYLQLNTADEWEKMVAMYAPNIVIHTAWHIRELYGDRKTTWKWNIEGSDKVFEYALSHKEVDRLVHFSTVSSYGAFETNTIAHEFSEDEPFRKSEYLYAEEKRICEDHLKQILKNHPDTNTSVSVIRPAAITGPRGRFMRIRFGLQSALSGQLKDNFIYKIISALVSFVPVTKKWLRQFIHEDDIVALVERLAFGEKVQGLQIFNACPPGEPVLGADMARAVNKMMVPVPEWLVRIGFYIFWHISRGKVPTGPGAWRGYSYPIRVTGEKATRELGFKYTRTSFDAFYYTDGEYEWSVPEGSRRKKVTIA